MKIPGLSTLCHPLSTTPSPDKLWLEACIQQHRPCRQDTAGQPAVIWSQPAAHPGHCNELLFCGPFSALLSSFYPSSLSFYSTKPSVIVPAGARQLPYCCLYATGSKLSLWGSIMGGRVSCWASLRPKLNLKIFPLVPTGGTRASWKSATECPV